MHRKRWIAVSAVLFAALLVAGAVGASAVFAQEPEPEAEVEAPLPHRLARPRGGRGRLGPGWLPDRGGEPWERFDALAEALELTPEELFAELHEGKTIEEIAESQGVDIEALRQEREIERRAERDQAIRERIAQVLEKGDISEEQAEWLLEGLDNGFLHGLHRFGLGAAPRGRGRGMGLRLPRVSAEGDPAPAAGEPTTTGTAL